MKNKKYLFILFFLGFFAVFFLVKQFDNQRKKATNLKFLSKKKFLSKLDNIPIWMQRQIDNDFQNVSKISDKALNETTKTIKNNQSIRKNAFYRYRLVNNKLYRLFFEEDTEVFNDLDFERAIRTLTKMIKLPDLDLIYTDLDGLPSDLIDERVYMSIAPSDRALILCHAKLINSKNLVLIPDHNSLSRSWKALFDNVLNEEDLWTEKKEKSFWRGGSNDQKYSLDNYKMKPRYIISRLSNKHLDLIDAGITKSWVFQLEDVLKQKNVIKNFASTTEHLKYKYLPVLDGHMCSYPGFQWRLLSHSICFKQKSDQIQWFYQALKPYEHYIPIEHDLSDLVDKIVWAKKNDEECKKIAKHATDFAMNNLALEDIYVYLYEVLKTYSERQGFSELELLKDIKKDKRWISIQNRKKANRTLKKLRNIR